MSEAVSNSICRIDTGYNHERALEFVVTGFVKKIADGGYANASSRKECDLARCAAFAQSFACGIEFSPAATEIAMGNGKICAF